MIIEYREIKPSKIKPIFSATPRPFKKPERPYLVPAKPAPKETRDYMRSYRP